QKLSIPIPLLESAKETRVLTVTKETTNGRRTLGFILGGVGVAGVAVAAVTGVMILGDKSTADAACKPKCLKPDGTQDQNAVDAVNQGKTLVPINLIGFVVGAVGLGAGTFFLLTSRKHDDKAATTVRPYAGPGEGGLVISGAL